MKRIIIYLEVCINVNLEGQISNSFYILKDGECLCKYEEKTFRQIKRGELFGFTGLLYGAKRGFDVVATRTSTVLSITITTLKEVYGNDYKKIFQNFLIKSAIIKDDSHTFSALIPVITEEILSAFEVTRYIKNEKVIDSFSNVNDWMRIILEGEIYDGNLNDKLRHEIGDIMFAEDVYYNYDRKQDKALFTQ